MKNRPHHRAVNECRLDRDFSGFTRNKKTAFRRLSDDVSDWIPGASWNSASCNLTKFGVRRD